MASSYAERATTAAGGSDPQNFVGSGENDISKFSLDQLAKQETVAALQRDYVVEALRIAALKASHAADDITIGDDDCAERGIRMAIQNLREAATGFRQLEHLNAARAVLRQEGANQ